jgi:hypothetical protein
MAGRGIPAHPNHDLQVIYADKVARAIIRAHDVALPVNTAEYVGTRMVVTPRVEAE